MTLYYAVATVTVDADSPEEAIEILNASMPSSGAVRHHGTVGLITGVTTTGVRLGRASFPAVTIDAQDIRDEMTDEMAGWTEEAWQAIDQLPDSTINDRLRDGFTDDFWAAVGDVRIETIGYLLDEVGLSDDKRRVQQ